MLLDPSKGIIFWSYMKDLVVGDLHGRKNNIEKVEQVLKECRALAVECDRTILLGDIFDEKAYLRTEIADLYKKYFSDWPNELIILVGNHDYSNSTECKVHSLELFKGIPNVTIVDQMRLDFKTNSLFMPYRHNNEEVLKFLTNVPMACQKDITIYGHQGIDGCQYSSGSFEKSPLKKDHFKPFKRVFMGHIHKTQEIANVVYVGTPFTKDYGEANETKHVAIFTHESNHVNYVSLNVPRHLIFKYEITSIKDLKKIKEELQAVKNDLLRLVIRAPETVAKKVKAAMFDVPIDSLKVESIKEKTERTSISEHMGYNDMCKQYLQTMQTDFDINELAELSQKIIEKVEKDK